MSERHTIITNVPRSRERVRGWVVREGTRELPLPASGLVIGSGKDVGLRVEDPRASRSHAQLVPEARGVRVRDLGSTNGTVVDGKVTHDALVGDGARVVIGRTVLTLHEVGRALQPSARSVFGKLHGTSVAMREVFTILEQVVESNASVLVEGETGTGKELVARALHSESNRAKQPFVVLDCGAIPANLIESELFGHVRGAFTGAERDRTGAFEAADGGTVFLDEIGELPLELQPKLLRAIEAQEIRRVGETRSRRVNVRVVSATNRDLEREVNKGRFREDLYFRLAVISARVPPL
ncbi:MAG: sigma-54-dependent Fis family transcriptional regulator, partial [Polyangia bacterium]